MSKERRKMVVLPDGTVKGLWHDRLPYRELGHVTVVRASDVEYDHERGLWVAVTPGGEEIASSPDRDAAIRGEVKRLEERL